MNFLKKITCALVLILSQIGNAQNVDQNSTLSLNSGTLNNQFEYIIKNSNRYKDFKVVKTSWLNTLKSHVLDSIKVVKNDLLTSNNLIKSQSNDIASLNTELQSTKDNLLKVEAEKSNMSLFGLQMSKTKYNCLMWAIIAILFVLLLIFIFKFKSSNTITNEAKLKLKDLEVEYEDHRRVALEREQKVRRQLQDEINKSKS